jgi:uncharacterized membrane protein
MKRAAVTRGRQAARATPPGGSSANSSTLDDNVRIIKRWESGALRNRSRAERLADWITHAAATGTVLVCHVGWFGFWILANGRWIPGITPFDPFPFPLLTMIVSLEAIFLTLFVLASQNRLSVQSDKRGHLDLQVDLLAEREMTIVLHLLQDIVQHLEIKTSIPVDQIAELESRTDIYKLAGKLEDMPNGTAPNGNPSGHRRG